MESNEASIVENNTKAIILYKGLDLIGTLAKYAAITACAYFVVLAIQALAGMNTDANFSFLVDTATVEEESYISWILTAVTSVWAFVERSLRQRKVEHFHAHNKKLEELHDSNRTSSNLLKDGSTNPDDVI